MCDGPTRAAASDAFVCHNDGVVSKTANPTAQSAVVVADGDGCRSIDDVDTGTSREGGRHGRVLLSLLLLLLLKAAAVVRRVVVVVSLLVTLSYHLLCL